jgi:hypothetical protein
MMMPVPSYMLVGLVMDLLGAFATLVVLGVAIWVAVRVTRNRQGAAGGWIHAVGRGGVFLAAACFLLLDVVTMLVGLGGIAWLDVLFRLLVLVSTLVTGVGLVMIRPRAGEVGHV